MKLSASEHTVPQDSLNCAVGLERDRKRGTCDYHDWGPFRCAVAYCFQIISGTPLPWCDKLNGSSQNLKLCEFIYSSKWENALFPITSTIPFFMNIVGWLSRRNMQVIFHTKIKRKNKKLCVLKVFLHYFVIIMTI